MKIIHKDNFGCAVWADKGELKGTINLWTGTTKQGSECQVEFDKQGLQDFIKKLNDMKI